MQGNAILLTKTLKPALTLLRELGVRLVAYIDNILVMTETEEIARDHTCRLLEDLGFIVHSEKSVTTPSQELEFLGMSGLTDDGTTLLHPRN